MDGPVVASVWRAGAVVARAELPSEDVRGTALDGATGTLVFERIVAEASVPRSPEIALSLAVVSGHDGLRFRLDGKTVYFTPDDLVAMQAYDHGLNLESLSLGLGVDVPLVVARASEQLGRASAGGPRARGGLAHPHRAEGRRASARPAASTARP